MARKKNDIPLIPEKRCPTCSGSVVRETFDSFKPGQIPKRLTVLRCISQKRKRTYVNGAKNGCPLHVIEEVEIVVEKTWIGQVTQKSVPTRKK